jgi:PTS system beta-glucosides-specific IIC component
MTLGFTDIPNPPAEAPKPSGAARGGVATALRTQVVLAPVAGRVIALDAVPDAVFSSGALGAGAAVVPSAGRVVAPVDGEVLTVLPHAYGLRTVDGVEVLVHVGLDTVRMAGEGFAPAVTPGSQVVAGELLGEFDLAAVVAAGYDPSTVVVVTRSPDGVAVTAAGHGSVGATDVLLRIG